MEYYCYVWYKTYTERERERESKRRNETRRKKRKEKKTKQVTHFVEILTYLHPGKKPQKNSNIKRERERKRNEKQKDQKKQKGRERESESCFELYAYLMFPNSTPQAPVAKILTTMKPITFLSHPTVYVYIQMNRQQLKLYLACPEKSPNKSSMNWAAR